jgi:hypothetical protein
MAETESAVASDISTSAGYAQMSRDLDSMSGPETNESESDPPVEASAQTADPAPPPETPPHEELEAPIEEPPQEDTEPADAAAAEKPAAPAGDEELPEGVAVRDRNGKQEFVLNPNRYRLFHGAYSTLRDVENIFGEEVTPEVAQLRQEAYISHDRMVGDFLSGDPQMEERFLSHLLKWSKEARNTGDVEHNPLQTLAAKLPEFLAQAGESEALQALTAPLIRHTFDRLYPLAYQKQQAGNENLRKALQWIDNELTGSYRSIEQMAAMLPEAESQRAQNLDTREARINQREEQHRSTEFENWRQATSASIVAQMQTAVKDTLKPVEAAYKNFPREYEGLVQILDNQLKDALKRDPAWMQLIERSTARARKASAAVRSAVAEDLLARYQAKAKFVLDPARNTQVKEILAQRAGAIKAQSDAQHERLRAGATRREPGAVGSPVPQTIRDQKTVPNGKSLSGRQAWEAAVDAALR